MAESSIRSRRGSYLIRLAPGPENAFPQKGVPELQITSAGWSGSVDLNPDAVGEGLLALQGVVRSLFRTIPICTRTVCPTG